ncbi:hypothetical protein LINPERHAP1_LOCUS8491 [Linum perenne]
MSDGWTDKRGRTLINFLVYCSRGLCFIKSVDATKEIKTAKVLFKMFDEVIKWIGVDNVVQVVTDNASNYLKCGKVIHRTYPHIYWTPCAAHCINLILKDIAALPHVSELFAKASKISVFVYNHQPVLNWLKAREGWKEIVRPAVTIFKRLQSDYLVKHQHHLDVSVIGVRIHTDRRNKLEEDKLCDLVFVNYNLKLKNRDHYNTEKLNTDPFDSEWISSTDFWVLDDQGSTPTPELNYEELMAALDEEMGRTTIGADEGTSRKRRRTEDDVLSSTGSDSEDAADIGDEVAQAENHMDTGPSGVGRDDQDTRYLFDDTSLF